MSEALTVLDLNVQLAKGGIGLGSKLFKVNPASIQLTQRMTQGENIIPGKIRVKETGQHFDEMQLVLLFEPVERRSYFEGADYSPDNQVCFSMDCVQPSPKAKVPQALYCANCAKGSWEKFRVSGKREDVPPCKNYWHCLVVDRVTQLPYYLDIRSTSIKPFMKAMQNIARIVALLQTQGKNPNIFDFSFKIYPVSEKNGQYYTYGFKDVAPISEADRTKFGNIYVDFLNRGNKPVEEEVIEAEVLNESLAEPTGSGTSDEPIPF